MLIEKRQEMILQEVLKKGSLSYKDAEMLTKCSKDTVRRDFIKLEENKLVTRTRGGILRNDSFVLTYDKGVKNNAINKMNLKNSFNEIKNFNEKKAIAKKAASYINGNEIIFLDSGSTMQLMAKNISHQERLTLLTNCLRVVNELATRKDIHTIMLGGDLNVDTLNISGADSINMIKNYHVDKLFLATATISLEKGLMSPYSMEAMLKKELIKNANKVFLLVDSSKINKHSLYLFADIADISLLITDEFADKEFISELKKTGITVDTVLVESYQPSTK